MSIELEEEFNQPDLKEGKGHGQDLTPSYLSLDPVSKGYTGAFHDEMQELSDTAKDMYSLYNIDDATGVYLDRLGKLLGLARTSSDDEVYRQALKTQISELLNSGQIRVIKNLFKNLTGSDNVKLFEHYPAAFRLEVTTNNPILRALRPEIDKAKVAGVGYEIIQAQESGGEGQEGYFTIIGVTQFGQSGQAATTGGAFVFGQPNIGITGFSKRLV